MRSHARASWFLVASIAALGASLDSGCSDEAVDPVSQAGAGATGGAQSSGAGAGAQSSGGGGAGGGYDGPCTVLAVGDTALYFASVASIGLQAPVLPPVEDLAKTRLTLELYEDDGSGALPPLAPGALSFANAPDDNYGTCQHCVLLVAFDLGGTPKRAFYPASGEMELERVPVDFDGMIVGRAHGMELVEVTQEEDFSWLAPAGGTLHLTLTQPADDFSLYVQNGCGPVARETYVSCSNFAPIGEEETTLPLLTAGQAVTVIVDGFTVADEGPYVLTATFEPE